MQNTCETVKVKRAHSPTGYQIINKSDFVEGVDELHTESPTAEFLLPADDKGAVLGDSDSAPCLPDNSALTKAELLEKLAAITDLAKPAMSKAELLDMLNELEASQ